MIYIDTLHLSEYSNIIMLIHSQTRNKNIKTKNLYNKKNSIHTKNHILYSYRTDIHKNKSKSDSCIMKCMILLWTTPCIMKYIFFT